MKKSLLKGLTAISMSLAISSLSIPFNNLVGENIFAEETNEFISAPLSPKYIDYLENPDNWANAPLTIDMSYAEDVSVERVLLPEKFNLVDKGVVSTIKDQEKYGTCWAFGITASMETSLIKYNPYVDLSEWHLA